MTLPDDDDILKEAQRLLRVNGGKGQNLDLRKELLDWIDTMKGFTAAPVVASVESFLSSTLKAEAEGTLGFMDFVSSPPTRNES